MAAPSSTTVRAGLVPHDFGPHAMRHEPKGEWKSEEVDRLLEIIARNEAYHCLLVYQGPQTRFSSQRPTKASIAESVFRELYPGHAFHGSRSYKRLTDKLIGLRAIYQRERRKHTLAGQSMTAEELEVGSSDWRQRQRTIKHVRWFEVWHKAILRIEGNRGNAGSARTAVADRIAISDSEDDSSTDDQQSDNASEYNERRDPVGIRRRRPEREDYRQEPRKAGERTEKPRRVEDRQATGSSSRLPPTPPSPPSSIRHWQVAESPSRVSQRPVHKSSEKGRADDVHHLPIESRSTVRAAEDRHRSRRHEREDERRCEETTADRLQVPRRSIDMQASAIASSSRTTLQPSDSGRRKRRAEDESDSAPAHAPTQAFTQPDDRDRTRRYEMGLEIRREALGFLDRHQQLQAKYQETLLKTIALITEGGKDRAHDHADLT